MTDPQVAALVEAAHRYIGRYHASTEQLRRVLARRVDKLVREGALTREEAKPLIEAAMAKVTGAGLMDDRRFAAARARSLMLRGRSRARIQEALVSKGIKRDDLQAALAALDDERRDPELAAALAYAKRRRLGPYRREGAGDRSRELAMLARAGFGLSLARRIVEAETAEALEAEAC